MSPFKGANLKPGKKRYCQMSFAPCCVLKNWHSSQDSAVIYSDKNVDGQHKE